MKNLTVLAAALLGFAFCGTAVAKTSITVWEDLNKASSLEQAAKDFEKEYDCKVVLVEKDSIKQFKEVQKRSKNGMSVPDAFILISNNEV